MAENKGASKASGSAGQTEVQNQYDEAARRGYFGSVPDQPPNSAYSVQSGPDAPTAFEEHIAINEQRIADQKASPAKEAK